MKWLRKLMHGRSRRRPWRLLKQESASGLYYYIPAHAHRFAGWLRVPGADWPSESNRHWMREMPWLPFQFWKVKSGKTSEATPLEIRLYRKMVDDIRNDFRPHTGELLAFLHSIAPDEYPLQKTV